jgi:hypothetical protein
MYVNVAVGVDPEGLKDYSVSEITCYKHASLLSCDVKHAALP